jgi:hypothetical protein
LTVAIQFFACEFLYECELYQVRVARSSELADSNLMNPWGIAASATSPFWISNNHSGTATVYNSNG